MSENWPQGGSGVYGEDPYARPETGPAETGRGRRRAGAQPQPAPAPPQRPDPRTRPQRPQDLYSGQGGQSGPGSQDPYAQGPYGGDSGSYPTGQYPAGPGADPYATGGGYPPSSSAPPRRPQQPQPSGRPQAGRSPYVADPQSDRSSYGRDLYDSSDRYDSGQTGQFERQSTGQFERPSYDRRAADPQAYDPPPYERQPYERESYDRDPYREDPRTTTAGGRRRAAQDPDLDARDLYVRGDEDDAPRTRRRGGASRYEQEEQDRFRLIDDEDGGDGDDGGNSGGGGRPGRPKQPKRGRNCLAVLIAFAVLAGGFGIGGYEAYQWYQKKHTGPADYTATTNSSYIDVVIPAGSGGTAIGGILYKADVVESQAAFVTACANNPQCSQIEANTYLLPEKISAAAAVTLLLNPTSVDTKGLMSTYGGERAEQVFAVLEAKKGWSAAAITAAMNSGKIGLPTWDTAKAGAKYPYAPIEGFIASEQYNLSAFSTPQALLTKMVADQMAVFTQVNLAARATALHTTEYNLLIIASMAQAEAASPTDLGNIAQVVFNRLKDTAGFSHLGFDTVTLYGLGNTVTVPTESDLEDSGNPYNTHLIVGLPPSPIGNPDLPALTAAANPTANDYLYFCAVSSTNTQYASSNAGWAALGRQYPTQCGGG